MHPRVEELVRTLALSPHPEGGHYRRIHASAVQVVHGGHVRPAMTAIEFLLEAGHGSQWHRVDADESWHWQEGAPLELRIFDETSGESETIRLASARDGRATAVVPAGAWQSARTLGDYTRVVCTVAPGFVWEGFELLDADGPVATRLRALDAPDVSAGRQASGTRSP